MKKLKLKKWKGDACVDEQHRHDYRWIEDLVERTFWIIQHYELTMNEYRELIADLIKGAGKELI